MSEKQDKIAEDLNDIVKKMVEINTQYFKESFDLVSQLSNSRKQKKTINPFQPELIAGAITAFAQLNLSHYKNVADLGFELSRKIVNSDFEPANDPIVPNEKDVVKPSFILRETVFIGSSVLLQFVLDNTKKEESTCTFKNLEFINQNEPIDKYNFETTFTPQSFNIQPGKSQAIQIEVKIGAKVKPGSYQSKVEIIGFDTAHFLINLSVIKEPTKTEIDE